MTIADQSDSPAGKPHLWQRLKPQPRFLEFSDAVILIYIAAFVRQYLWPITNNSLAWALTILLSVLIWLVHLRTKGEAEEKTPSQFWLIVALPLFVIYAMRAAFPDMTFDVLDYRLINAERALVGFPFITGDFFPTRFPFNPASDMVTGISRHLLGYRLGTIINYLVVLWVGTILNRFLRPYIESVWLRSVSVLLLLLTEHVLFLINNYMVDLLALPLLLEATRLALGIGGSKNQNHNAARIAVFLGASVAFKLTNLAFALPILIIYAYNIFRADRRPNLIRVSVVMFLAFVAPLLPFTLYIYWQTGNPTFPLYNKIFMSHFWPTDDFVGMRWGPVVDDPRWGNMKWWEILLWPILLPFKLEHTAGDLGRHVGRLSICFAAGFIGLLLKTKNGVARSLSFIVLLGAILWSAISGMPRYALFVELAGGIAIIYLVTRLRSTQTESNNLRLLKRGTQVLLWSVLAVQSAIACVYVYRFEWGSRPTVFEHPRSFARDSKYFLRDYSLTSFLPPREKNLVGEAQAWTVGNALESGIEVALNDKAPGLCLYMPEYFSTEESRARFASAIRDLGDRKMFTLSFSEHLEGSVFNINRAGLRVGQITQLAIPYYSEHSRIHMALIEVLRPGEGRPGDPPKITRAGSALPDEALRAEIVWSQPLPATFRAGLKETVYVKVKNVTNFVWPALGNRDGAYRLFLGNHWLDENNKTVVNDDARSILLYDLAPNEEVEVPVTINAPMNPGNYVLEIDMLQEGVTWFNNKGSKTLRYSVKVD